MRRQNGPRSPIARRPLSKRPTKDADRGRGRNISAAGAVHREFHLGPGPRPPCTDHPKPKNPDKTSLYLVLLGFTSTKALVKPRRSFCSRQFSPRPPPRHIFIRISRFGPGPGCVGPRPVGPGPGSRDPWGTPGSKCTKMLVCLFVNNDLEQFGTCM